MPIPERSTDHPGLPWDVTGNCSDDDVDRDELPLYHETAVEAWVMEHPAGAAARLHEASIAAIGFESQPDPWPHS